MAHPLARNIHCVCQKLLKYELILPSRKKRQYYRYSLPKYTSPFSLSVKSSSALAANAPDFQSVGSAIFCFISTFFVPPHIPTRTHSFHSVRRPLFGSLLISSVSPHSWFYSIILSLSNNNNSLVSLSLSLHLPLLPPSILAPSTPIQLPCLHHKVAKICPRSQARIQVLTPAALI